MKGSKRERGGGWVILQAVVMLAVLGLSLKYHTERSNTALLAAGILFMGLGGAFGIAGVRALGTNLTPFPKPAPHARLVRQGIYRWVRHPLYTSVTLLAIGWALAWQSSPALGAAICLVPLFEAKARCEERWLRAKFVEYADYAKDTRKFIPWVY